jgi:SAM-dependent methyltransferase
VNPDEYIKMRQLEDHYWWFVSRRRLALDLWRRYAPTGVVLDLGCGTGAVAEEIARSSEVVGLDFTRLALNHAADRGLRSLVQGDGARLPFRAESFSAIVALDIFEHIENHESAFAEAARVLRPGGVLVLSVPAYRWLWGPHDVALHHFRRYTRSWVRRSVAQAGLEPVTVSYSVFLLFPVVILERLWGKFRRGPARSSLPPVSSFSNWLLVRLMAWEARGVVSPGWPWGSSVVAVARKPEG